MTRPPPLPSTEVDAWLKAHVGWNRAGDVLVRDFKFPDFSAALAFVVRVGMLAEKIDHHPDLEVSWGRARVSVTTHEPKGLTQLDLALAEGTERILE